MPNAVRVILAVLAGIVAGSLANFALLLIGGAIVPPPEGVDVMKPESIKASMHLFEPKHFVFPWLAHALGTLVGAIVATLIAPGRKPLAAYIVGGFFFLGGLANVFMLPGPTWFAAADLLLAYAPMAWLGHRVMSRGSNA